MKFIASALILGVLASTASAAVKLPAVTCPGDARCKFSSDRSAYGTVGEGIPFSLGGFTDRVGSGFISEADNALILAFETGGQLDNRGAIMKVDLATGNRTLISGTIDEMDSRGAGLAYTSDRGNRAQAWDLGNVYAVRPGPAGSVYALVDKLGEARSEILKVDLKTGNRTLVWASKLADDATSSSVADSIQNVEARLGVNSASVNSCERVKPFLTFEVDPKNGDLLLPTRRGLARVTPGKGCVWVSKWDGDVSVTGSGPVPAYNVVQGSTLIGREVTTISGPGNTGLYATNIDTGERRILSFLNSSTPARSKGKGDVYIGFLGAHAYGKTLFLTTGYTSQQGFAATTVNAAGDRAVIEGKGSLSTGRSSDMSVVAAIPGTDKFIVWYEKALHVFDPATGQGYVLSQ